jgi:hypothetical protein
LNNSLLDWFPTFVMPHSSFNDCLEGEELARRVVIYERIGGGTSGRVYRATYDGKQVG